MQKQITKLNFLSSSFHFCCRSAAAFLALLFTAAVAATLFTGLMALTPNSAMAEAKSLPKRDVKLQAAGTENAKSLKEGTSPLPAAEGSSVATAQAPGGKALDLPHAPKQASSQDMKTIRTLDSSYQKADSVKMDVDKTLKLGLLQQERKAKGTLLISAGRLRMDLSGEEKTLLVVNKSHFWAVTYPSAEFKDAPVQVIEGATSTTQKKGQQSQSILGVLTRGGFLKFFNVAGVQKEKTGEITYFLQPQKSASEFKRAELKVSANGKEIRELHYWDERDNETLLSFKDVTFGKRPAEANFNFEVPAGADVMNM